MPARFVVKKGTTGKFRFILVAANGEPIATSELYNSKVSCMSGIRAVRRVAADAPVDDLTTPPPKAPAKSPKKTTPRKAPTKAKAAAKRPAAS